MTDRELMQMALQDIQNSVGLPKEVWKPRAFIISQLLHERLSQPEPEPVAWKHDCAALLQNDVELWIDRCPHCGKPRPHPAIVSRAEEAYEAAKQREWVGLDDEEVYGEAGKHERFANNGSEWFDRGSFAKAIEAKLKEKNT